MLLGNLMTMYELDNLQKLSNGGILQINLWRIPMPVLLSRNLSHYNAEAYFSSKNFCEQKLLRMKKVARFLHIACINFYELIKKEIFECINILESIKYEILTEINFRKL